MYTVLLAIDSDTERSRRSAKTVAKLPKADSEVEVTVLNVFEEFKVNDGDGGTVSSEDIFDDTSTPESLDKTVEFLEEQGVSVTARREHGDPATRIVEVADEINANLIVMGGRQRSPIGKALFGSVVQAVLLDARRPVTVSMSE